MPDPHRRARQTVPVNLDDLAPPETRAAQAALDLAEAYYSPALLEHAHRSWLWAEAFASTEQRTDIDHELLYVAALLHDIGITVPYDNATLSYEEAGGHVAIALTTGAGWEPDRRRRALEVVVRHNWPSVDPVLDQEGYLLELATGADITGAGAQALPARFVRDVLARHPRGSLAAEFTACVSDQAARKPATAARRILDAGLAERMRRHPFEPTADRSAD